MRIANNFVLWGSSGHAKVLAETIAVLGGVVIALFDNNHDARSVIPGVPIFTGERGFLRWINNTSDKGLNVSALVAIGGDRGKDRLRIQTLFREYDFLLPVLRHPSATVSPAALFGEGTQILAQCNVASDVKVGGACILNHQSSVDHECVIGNGVHIGPSATLCGCVSVGDHVFVGAGAVVLPRISIGENSIIGAGSIVTKDVPPNTVVMGNPAKHADAKR